MHPVADKIKLSEFEGTIELGDRKVGVSFDDGTNRSHEDHVEPTTFVVRGLTMEEAYDLIAVALKSAKTVRVTTTAGAASAEILGVPAHHEDRIVDEKRRADEAIAKVKSSAAAASVVKPAKPAVPPKPESEPVAEEEDDLDGESAPDAEADDNTELNVVLMNQQDKLRPVIEHMIDRGYKTAAAIVAAAIPLKDKVSAFKAVDAKGSFEKRIERAALVVLAGDGE